jgi:hypothetical protein
MNLHPVTTAGIHALAGTNSVTSSHIERMTCIKINDSLSPTMPRLDGLVFPPHFSPMMLKMILEQVDHL